ncbi:MAG: ATP-binding cassette domain-containing protein, partial [Opitutales bacterium]|nr:ATP-binding cassette domain-containing protein [Opitutales bacterium]
MKHQEKSTNAAPLLDIRKLHLSYASGRGGKVRAVDGVSLSVKDGETLGIVGESGCGKSTLARALMGLARPDSGQIIFGGKNLLSLSAAELRRARLDFQMVFQDPYASLDPCMTVGRILAEAIDRRKKLTRAGMDARIAQMLEKVGLPTEAATRYPHEFSGG